MFSKRHAASTQPRTRKHGQGACPSERQHQIASRCVRARRMAGSRCSLNILARGNHNLCVLDLRPHFPAQHSVPERTPGGETSRALALCVCLRPRSRPPQLLAATIERVDVRVQESAILCTTRGRALVGALHPK